MSTTAGAARASRSLGAQGSRTGTGCGARAVAVWGKSPFVPLLWQQDAWIRFPIAPARVPLSLAPPPSRPAPDRGAAAENFSGSGGQSPDRPSPGCRAPGAAAEGAIFPRLLVPAALWCCQCLPAWQVRACLDPVDEVQKMAELLGLRDECGEGTLGAPALAGSCLADNRLNLDVYPDGCRRFLQLFKEQQGELIQVEFLRLSSNDCLLDTTLGSLPHLKHLKSLVLKGQTALGSVLFQCPLPQIWLSLAQS